MTSVQSEVNQLYDLLEVASEAWRSRFGRLPSPADLQAPPRGSGTRGVYFFFEPGEYRANREVRRIVRVGSHRSDKSSIEGRIVREHVPDWGRSVFRRHVGTALIRRGDFDVEIQPADRDRWAEKWYGQVDGFPAHTDPARLHPRLHALHPIVSRTIASMSVVWVQIADGAHRLKFERQCIRLLSNYRRDTPIDPASDTWLGRHALSLEVRTSGLWNHQHVKKSHRPGFLDSFLGYFSNKK